MHILSSPIVANTKMPIGTISLRETLTYSVGKHVPCRQRAAHGGAAGHTTSGQQVRQSANVWVYDVYEYPLVMEHVLWATPRTRRRRILTLTMLIVWGDAITA